MGRGWEAAAQEGVGDLRELLTTVSNIFVLFCFLWGSRQGHLLRIRMAIIEVRTSPQLRGSDRTATIAWKRKLMELAKGL